MPSMNYFLNLPKQSKITEFTFHNLNYWIYLNNLNYWIYLNNLKLSNLPKQQPINQKSEQANLSFIICGDYLFWNDWTLIFYMFNI